MLDLPYENNTFDAIWCAAISQYLTDDELVTMLAEFRHVLKPGGLIGIKDFSGPCLQWQPLDPWLLSRITQAVVDAGDKYFLQVARDTELPTWVKRAGFKVIHAKTTMVERWQPLRDVEKRFFEVVMGSLAAMAKANDLLSESDHAIWAQLGDVGSSDHILHHPDFYYGEGHIVVVAENVL